MRMERDRRTVSRLLTGSEMPADPSDVLGDGAGALAAEGCLGGHAGAQGLQLPLVDACFVSTATNPTLWAG